MDIHEMTAPCGLDCFNCHFFLAPKDPGAMETVEKISQQYNMPVEIMLCKGCRAHDGRIPLQIEAFGDEHRCAAYECAKEKKLSFCCDCDEFPCRSLHPYADMAGELPHNFKVYNLCLIKRLGLEKWAETRASDVRRTYFNQPWSLTEKPG